jgi:hypothetical protein
MSKRAENNMRRRWQKKVKEEADYQRDMRKSAGLFGIDGDRALSIEAVELMACITVTQGSGFYPRTFSWGFTTPNTRLTNTHNN